MTVVIYIADQARERCKKFLNPFCYKILNVNLKGRLLRQQFCALFTNIQRRRKVEWNILVIIQKVNFILYMQKMAKKEFKSGSNLSFIYKKKKKTKKKEEMVGGKRMNK